MHVTHLSYLIVLTMLPRAALAQEPEPFDLAAALRAGPPMSADRAAEIAMAAAPPVERARALARASEAAVSRARAAMLPRVELIARYAHVDGFPDGQVGTPPDPARTEAARMLAMQITDPASRALWLGSIDQQIAGPVTIRIPRDQVSLSARLTWPASDMFFAMLPALEAAEAGARERARLEEAALADVGRSAREAFYQLARARGAHAVAQQSAREAQTQLERVETSVRAGYLTSADQLGAQARVAAAEQMVAQAEAGVEIADAALRTLLDQDDGAIYGIADPIFDVSEEVALDPVVVLSGRALAQRPEIAALRESIASQHAAGRASDATGYPHLAFFAGADLASPNRYVVPPSEDLAPSWELGVTLTYVPNDTLTAVHRGEELRAQLEATEADLAQLERAVRLEVRRAHASVRAAQRTLTAARAALAAAESAYESRDAQLQAGQATSADLLTAQNDLDRARFSVLDAAVQLQASRAQLAYAVGHP